MAEAPTTHPDHGRRRRFLLPLAVALAYLLPALACLGDYGPTYDAVKGDLPYGERLLGYLGSFDPRWLELKATEPVPVVRSPHPDFNVGRFPSVFAFPVGALLSAISCRLLWTELGLVPALSAHHLPFVLLTATLVFVVSAFAAARLGPLAAIVAGGSLFLTPSLFGHSFNNARDIPECCFYTCAVLAGFRAVESGSARAWLPAGALTGLSLAQKANGLFLPVQLLVFLAGTYLVARARREPGLRVAPRGILLAALAFVLVYYAVSPAFWSHPIEGPKMWLGEMMSNANHAAFADRGSSAVSFAAVQSVLDTTPLVTLGLALCGVFRPGLPFRLRFFLVVSVGVPIGRNLIPGMRHFNGTRHFLEFLPMLSLLAGAGAAWLAESARRVLPRVGSRLASGAVGMVALAPSAWAVIDTHPNQIVYFNALAGGLGGAQARHDPEAGDFWGNSYWQGMAWLSAHAAPGERVLVPFKNFIARAGAPVRLRPDIRILNERITSEMLPLTVMHLVNIGIDAMTRQMDGELEPVYTIRVQNGAVLHIHRLERDPQGEALIAILQIRASQRELREFLRKNRSVRRVVMQVMRARVPLDEARERLRDLVPEKLMRDLEVVLSHRGHASRARAEKAGASQVPR